MTSLLRLCSCGRFYPAGMYSDHKRGHGPAQRLCKRCGDRYPTGTYSEHRLSHPVGLLPRTRTSARNAAVVARINAGESGADIGLDLGITRERVRQIYKRVTGESIPLKGTLCRVCSNRYMETPAEHVKGPVHTAAVDLRWALRFWDRVEQNGPDECWPFRGGVNRVTGYGSSHLFGQSNAHRVAYFLTKGPIPEGLTLDHLCRNRQCVNPAHLEAVPHRINILRSPTAAPAVNARRTHCKHGHPFSGDNLIVTKHGRRCRTCYVAMWKRSNAQAGEKRRLVRAA